MRRRILDEKTLKLLRSDSILELIQLEEPAVPNLDAVVLPPAPSMDGSLGWRVDSRLSHPPKSFSLWASLLAVSGPDFDSASLRMRQLYNPSVDWNLQLSRPAVLL